jgi:hypothetical protein
VVASSVFDAALCYRSISHNPHADEHDPSACGGQLLIVSLQIMTITKLIGKFSSIARPDDFINKYHCDECLEHYDSMAVYTPETLEYKIIENPGWDPTCFLTPSGFRYYLPGLVRLANEHHEWIGTLISRLTGYQRPGLSTNDKDVIKEIMNAWLNDDSIDDCYKDEIREYLIKNAD